MTIWSTSSPRAIHGSGALGGIIISVPVSETMEPHNSASSNAATKVFKIIYLQNFAFIEKYRHQFVTTQLKMRKYYVPSSQIALFYSFLVSSAAANTRTDFAAVLEDVCTPLSQILAQV